MKISLIAKIYFPVLLLLGSVFHFCGPDSEACLASCEKAKQNCIDRAPELEKCLFAHQDCASKCK